MALRQVDDTDPTPRVRKRDLLQIIWSDDGILAIWNVPVAATGERHTLTVAVSPALATNLLGRATWTSALDAIVNDTFPRTNA